MLFEKKDKVMVPIVSITPSQFCNLRVGAHLHLRDPEPAVSCRHSSVMWAVGHTSPTAVAFPAFRPILNYTAWWQRHMCVKNSPRVFTWWWNG